MKTLIILALILLALLTLLSKSQTTSNITYDAGAIIDIGSGADVCADAIIINGTYSGAGTICSGPLPVELNSFTFSINKNNVTLTWETAFELNNSGFDVERAKINQNGTELWVKLDFVNGSGTTNEPKHYVFEDKKLVTGAYKYRLKQIDFNSNYEYFDLTGDVKVEPPKNFSMGQNYPNPSNPKSKIDYEIPFNGKVTIKLFNVLGEEVERIVDEFMEAGYYSTEFDGSNLSSGVYFYRIAAEDNTGQKLTKTLKMILVK